MLFLAFFSEICYIVLDKISSRGRRGSAPGTAALTFRLPPGRIEVTDMKTKYWIILLALLLAGSALACIPLLNVQTASQARITSDGEFVITVDLAVDQEFTVPSKDGGSNTVTVKDGAIAVTAADCPDHYCMDRGFCTGGAQIVCLPNRLVITFLGPQEIDGAVG